VIRPTFENHPYAGSEPGKHTIQTDETFWGLEQKNGWPNGTLQSLNPALDPRKLAIGQVINIPGGAVPTQTAPVTPPAAPQQRIHTVTHGENLTVIASRYGLANWRQIYDIPQNRAVIGGDPNLIKEGQQLIIP
jgi:LysM repeat protein